MQDQPTIDDLRAHVFAMRLGLQRARKADSLARWQKRLSEAEAALAAAGGTVEPVEVVIDEWTPRETLERNARIDRLNAQMARTAESASRFNLAEVARYESKAKQAKPKPKRTEDQRTEEIERRLRCGGVDPVIPEGAGVRKKDQSAAIADLTEAFLANGGRIETCPAGERGDVCRI